MDLGKAIMDSPIGFLIKAIAGIVGGVGGAALDAFGIGGGVTPAAVTSGNGRDAVGGQYAVTNNITFGSDAYSSINTSIGQTTRTSNGSRTTGRNT
jgi:hypothetical protein